MLDFEAVKDKAWSLPPGESRGKLIYVEETKYGTFQYFHDETDGSYWYQSEGTEKFHKNLKEREKKRKSCSRNLNRNLKTDVV